MNKENWIVFLGTYPPRECGIATFTRDLSRAVERTFSPKILCKVAAIHRADNPIDRYPKEVLWKVCQDDKEDYEILAEILNHTPEVKCVSIQHEYGIFGGEQGSHLLSFLTKIKKPVAITLHTVLPNPSLEMQVVTQAVLDLCDKIIVLTDHSKNIVADRYSSSEGKVEVVPHGIHFVPFTSPDSSLKKKLGLGGKTVLCTHGLLSRGKGIEYVIQALPEIVKKHPEIVYLIAGQTHPVVKESEGESYRQALEELVAKLNLEKNVKFHNSYSPIKEVLEILRATDIYVSTSLDPQQTASGTLSYAVGAGRATVSTKFAQARELLEGAGVLVDFKNPESYAEAFTILLSNPKIKEAMDKKCYDKSRNMLWSNVSISYLDEFLKIAPYLISSPTVTAQQLKLWASRQAESTEEAFSFLSTNVFSRKLVFAIALILFPHVVLSH